MLARIVQVSGRGPGTALENSCHRGGDVSTGEHVGGAWGASEVHAGPLQERTSSGPKLLPKSSGLEKADPQ